MDEPGGTDCKLHRTSVELSTSDNRQPLYKGQNLCPQFVCCREAPLYGVCTFILKDESRVDELRIMANEDDLDIVKGGRFYHLITRGQDKANAIKYLINDYEKNSDEDFKTIMMINPEILEHSEGTDKEEE